MGGLKDLTIRFVVGRKDFVTKAISVDCCCNVVSISGDDGVQSICGLWPVEADVIIAAVITAVCVFWLRAPASGRTCKAADYNKWPNEEKVSFIVGIFVG